MSKKQNKMKTITLKELKQNYPNKLWIETKRKGDNKYRETKLNTFTGKRVLMFDNECISFSCYEGKKLIIPIVNANFVKARVQIWNRETKENEYYKVIF